LAFMKQELADHCRRLYRVRKGSSRSVERWPYGGGREIIRADEDEHLDPGFISPDGGSRGRTGRSRAGC
jgi:hypothetical protein